MTLVEELEKAEFQLMLFWQSCFEDLLESEMVVIRMLASKDVIIK